MSITPPTGILDITDAIVRVSKLEFRGATGFDTVLNNVARNTALLVDQNVEYTTDKAWALKLPNAWVSEFDAYWDSGASGNIDFNIYNNTTSGTNGYVISMDDTTITVKYDGGSALKTVSLGSTLKNDTWRKIHILFERDMISLALDGTPVLYFKDTLLRPRVYDEDSGYVIASGLSADRKFKNLRILNGDKWMTDNTSNIAFVHGNVGIGTDAPTATLDVRGDYAMGGHIIPTSDSTYDIGAPEFKIRDLFVSNNSMWVGDRTKIAFENGKMKFKRRKVDKVPKVVRELAIAEVSDIADEADVETAAVAYVQQQFPNDGITALADLQLQHWKAYTKSIDETKEISDIFVDDDEDYEAQSAADAWNEIGSDIYSTHRTTIGSDAEPRATLDVNATDAIIVPIGTTAERPASAVAGMLRYNSTTGYFETYTPSGWGPIATPPSITSFSPNPIAYANVTTEDITVAGSFFDPQSSVQLEGADGTTLYDTTNFTFVDNETLRFRVGALALGQGANRPYKVLVTNGARLTTKSAQTLGFGSPTITSFSPNPIAYANVTTEDITVEGSFFDSQTNVQLEGADGTTLYNTTNFTFVDNATLRFRVGTPVSGQAANRPYKVVVTNGAGLTTKSAQTLGFGNPTWSSPASGSTREFSTQFSTTLTLSATDATGGSSVSYSLVSGSLPGGLTFSGNTISGKSTESDGTTNTVTIRATDTLDTSAFKDLTFTINSIVGLYSFSSHTFTNAGATGRFGPTLTQLRSAYTPTWTDDTNYLNVTTQGIQEWTVPKTGTYQIEVAGARGGDGSPSYPSHRGGYSRIVSGRVQLNVNDVLYIAVGQGGVSLNGYSSGGRVGGGGGGTFVVKNGTPLLVAGGGGGGGTESSVSYGRGNDVRSDNYSTYQVGTAYLNNGNGGGNYSSNYCGGGGGGFYSGGSRLANDNPYGGSSWSNGLTGSQGVLHVGNLVEDGSGGFGGGGGGWVNLEVRPGGGGGYSGGQGASYEKTRDSTHLGGGAGGNFINTSYVSNRSYGNQHTLVHGYATITLV